MLIVFNERTNYQKINYDGESFVKGDYSVHTIDVIMKHATEYDTYTYTGSIYFKREDNQSSPKLVMTPKLIEYDGKLYNGYTYKMEGEWFTALAGVLTATIDISQYNEAGLATNKAYGKIEINVEDSVSNVDEPSTITKEEYSALINFLNAKLNVVDEKVKELGDFNNIKLFADACSENYIQSRNEIFRGREISTYEGNADYSNSDTFVGIVNRYNTSSAVVTKVTVISGSGKIIVFENGTQVTNSIYKISNNEISSNKTTTTTLIVNQNATIKELVVNQLINALNANVVVNHPTVNNNPTTKQYVDEITKRLNEKIDGIEAAQNLLDIVANKAALDNYDTTLLKENDKIKVLVDETKGNAGTYYRWDGSAWHYIGKDGAYYTQTQVDNIKAQLQSEIDALKKLVNTMIANNVSYKEE